MSKTNINLKNGKLKKKSKSVSDRILFTVIIILLVALTLFLVGMLLWGLITSLKSERDYLKNMFGFPNLDPSYKRNSRDQFFHLQNYSDILKNFSLTLDGSYYKGNVSVYKQSTTGFFGMLINTLLYAGVGGLICALVPAMTAYLCVKYKYKLSGVVYVVYIVIMCVPIVGSQPTLISFLRNTGLYDTFFGNYLQKMSGAGMYFFVYYAFFGGLSNTYREAAEIDGASEMTILLRIYFPLAMKMIATVFLIQFVALWNDYQTPLLYLPTHPTLSYGVYLVAIDPPSGIKLSDVPHSVSACMMLALPILIVFVIFKDKIMGNISLGGIKE